MWPTWQTFQMERSIVMKRRGDASQQRRRPTLIDSDVRCRWTTDFEGCPPTSSTIMDDDVHQFFADRPIGVTAAAAAAAVDGSSRDFLSEFEGAFSSLAPSSSSPVFGYSQKNFHISDGNLYSVLSPFQARRSSARPSFLRGQSCVTSVNDSGSSGHHHRRHQQQQQQSTSSSNSSSSTFTSVKTSPDSGGSAHCPMSSSSSEASQLSGRRSKLKFHHIHQQQQQQDVPPVPRPSFAETNRRVHRDQQSSSSVFDSSEHWSSKMSTATEDASASAWFDREPRATTVFARDAESLFSKRRRPQTMSSAMDEDDDDRDVPDMDVDDRLFRRRHDETSSTRSRKSFHSDDWPFCGGDDDDYYVDEVDERVPLNLCMADRRRRLASSIRKDIGERIRRKTRVEADLSEARERRFTLSSFFDDFSMTTTTTNKSRSHPEAYETSQGHMTSEDDNDYDDDQVLDLSVKSGGRRQRTSSNRAATRSTQPPPQAPPRTNGQQQQQQTPPPLQRVIVTQNVECKPQISDMFQNMRIKDDDYMQDAVKRYNATRQLLMQTHPEMFGHDRPIALAIVKEDFGPRTASDAGVGSCGRPRSWNVSQHPNDVSLLESAVESGRPESAEPCLESAPFLVPLVASKQHRLPQLVPSASFSLNEQKSAPVTGQPTRRSASAPSIGPAAVTSRSVTSRSGSGGVVKSKPFGLMAEMPIKGSKSSPRPRKSVSVSPSSSQQHVNDISICKFKLIKGVNPVLEEKKSFFVPIVRSSELANGASQNAPAAISSSRPFFVPTAVLTSASMSTSTGGASIGDKLRMLKNQGSAATAAAASSSHHDNMGLRMVQPAGTSSCGGGVGGGTATKRLRRRSRKAVAREKLEATFREKGFLIRTHSVASAEGSVYCKFRQLRKFTRYLFKSWKDYLPKELEDMSTQISGNGSPPPPLLPLEVQQSAAASVTTITTESPPSSANR